MSASYDCIVLGGGPAGSTVAALLAAAGRSTLLVERGKLPRYHVGESLLPSAADTLGRLGVLEQLKAGQAPRHRGICFLDHAGTLVRKFRFDATASGEPAPAWHVLRGEFDQLLFDNAARKGAICRDQTRVVEILFDGDRACGIEAQSGGGAPETFRGRVLVDATGQQSLIANRLGLRQPCPRRRNAAIWTYYRGARQEPGDEAGCQLVLATRDRRAWFWWVPLAGELTGVGVVADEEYLLKGRGKPESVFEEELVNCPTVVERLIDATLAGEFRVQRDFSHRAARAAGDGWVLVGDALGFLDPIHPSGVFLALKSGELAADAILEGLSRGVTSAAQLGRWTSGYDQGASRIARLVEAFYAGTFPWRLSDGPGSAHVAALSGLLAGNVFDPAADAALDELERSQADHQPAAAREFPKSEKA